MPYLKLEEKLAPGLANVSVVLFSFSHFWHKVGTNLSRHCQVEDTSTSFVVRLLELLIDCDGGC